jgi:hypothetical protein
MKGNFCYNFYWYERKIALKCVLKWNEICVKLCDDMKMDLCKKVCWYESKNALNNILVWK